MKNLKILLTVTAVLALAITACRKEPMPANPEKNAMTVKMADNVGDYLGLTMEINRVEVYKQDSGWITLDNQTHFVDVTTLINGKNVTLAHQTNLAAGNYTKVKIVFGTHNKLTLKVDAMDGSNLRITNTLDLEYSGSKEVIVEIDAKVNADANAEVLIDFDVARSVVAGIGKYVVKPMLTWVKDTKTGVSGEVKGALSAAVIVTNGQDSFSTYIDAQGYFMLKGLKSGTYSMVVIPARQFKDEIIDTAKKIDGVVIVQGEIHSMGQIYVK